MCADPAPSDSSPINSGLTQTTLGEPAKYFRFARDATVRQINAHPRNSANAGSQRASQRILAARKLHVRASSERLLGQPSQLAESEAHASHRAKNS